MDPDGTVQAAGGHRGRHPRWGVVAQVTAIVGAVGLMVAMGLTWVGYSATAAAVNGLVADLDAATAEAQGKYDAAAAALDEQANNAANPDAQALLQDGADLVREVASQVTSIEGQMGDLAASLLTVLLGIVIALSVFLAYLVLVHGGIWTLGRHWRRD